MKCQNCGSSNLKEVTVEVPIRTPVGRVTIEGVPAIRCMECGKSFMSMIARSRVKKLFDEWEKSGERGNKQIQYKLIEN